MKKSILIFSLVSFTTSAFYYALKRSNGNLGQSIMFSMYCLSIKFNLIGSNLVMGLNQYYSNQQELVARTKVLPFYHPYIWSSNDEYYDRCKVSMSKIEPYVSYDFQSVVKKVRGGGRLEDAALFLAMLYMLKYHATGFYPVKPVVLPPHIEERNHLLFGKPKTDKVPSRFPTRLEIKKEYHQDNNFYNSEVDCYFSDRQLQKKYKHARSFGIRDSNYKPVNAKAFEKALVNHMKLVEKPINGSYHKKAVYHYYDNTTKLNVMVNKDDKTFISGWELSDKQIIHMKNGGNL